MTPEQCHLICCNSQQVEESAGWDKYSSNDLYDQQMDGQDGWSKRIYNNKGLTKRPQRMTVLRTLESSDREATENREEEELILELNPRISLYPFSTPLTIPLPNDPIRPLKKPSLRPSS